jgi:inorganic pyrophosphatase
MHALDQIPLRAKGGYNAIIETPRGSTVKFAYDRQTGMFVAKKKLPIGLSFPFAFGFLPSTRGGDGDPLDVMVLTDMPLPMGCLVHCRLIGALVAEQGRDEAHLKRNDRLLAVPLLKHQDRPISDIAELPEHELGDLEEFFRFYQRAYGHIFRTIDRLPAREADRLATAGAI